MTYPGNSSLASDVQQRILSTFEHTLGLAEKGSRQEALLGCDFVLRMDPLFEPARRLQERLEVATGPLAVDDLRRMEPAPAPAPAPASTPPARAAGAPAPANSAPELDPLWNDLEGLGSELPDLPDAHPSGLRAEFESLLAERRFQELQLRARAEATAVAGDLELQRLVTLAQERLEAGPYVSKFLLTAREALRNGNAAEGQRLLDKARSLDPTHPGIAELGGLGAKSVAAGASAGQSATAAAAALVSPAPPPAALGMAAAVPAASPQPGPSADSESEQRIRQLLDEGQAALDGGDPQAAIDAWSRIFLIDIDHQEAAQRIERARRIRAERDRQVEETFHDGLSHLQAGDPEPARQAFQKVLELQPGHLQAREYLQQLDEGGMPAVAGGGRHTAARPLLSPALAASPPALATAAGVDRSGAAAPAGAAGDGDLAADLQEEILVPPDLGGTARGPESRKEVRSANAPQGRARRMFLVVGSAVLLLVLTVGWFLYLNREQWFPNSRTEEPAQPPAPNPIPRAVKLHNSGSLAIALAQLSRVPAGDPHYKEAQALIAKWQAEEAQGSAGAPATPGAVPGAGNPGAPGTAGSAGVESGAAGAAGAAGTATAAGLGPATPATPAAERRRTLLEEARKAYGEGLNLVAAERFEAAGRLGKLEPGEAAQFDAAKQKLVPLQRQIAMFRGHDWEYALPELWRIHESEPANRDATRMIVDSYYDLGVRDLQHGDVARAAQKFAEAKNLSPDDSDVKRQLLFAQTYLERSPDLLYRIYAKYLSIR